MKNMHSASEMYNNALQENTYKNLGDVIEGKKAQTHGEGLEVLQRKKGKSGDSYKCDI